MEATEPKVGDAVSIGGRLTRIIRFDENREAQLKNGTWVQISQFERDSDGAWVRPGDDVHVFQIGEKYSSVYASRVGVAVIRSAVYEGGKRARVVTTSPCCPLESRRLSFDDIMSTLARRNGGWLDECTECGWHYLVSLEYTGRPQTGLYGVRWLSLGF